MSVDLTLTGRAVGSERVADEWERIEIAFAPSASCTEDQGLEIGWDDASLWLSLPLGQDKATHRAFGKLADTVAAELGRALDWEVEE